MTFKIKDDFQLTPRNVRKSKYPIADLAVGQGFLADGKTSPGFAYQAARSAGVEVATRVTPKGAVRWMLDHWLGSFPQRCLQYALCGPTNENR